MAPAPGVRACQKCIPAPGDRSAAYKWYTLVFTFFIYCSYHISRKPISVIKSILRPDNCSLLIENVTTAAPIQLQDTLQSVGLPPNVTVPTECGWAPFDEPGGKAWLGALDTAFLFPYAIGMFFSGHIAERVNLRHFLTCGMLLSGLFTALFGLGYFWNIHTVAFYIAMQALSGFAQATGWPSVVTCVANWFGKGKRGLIMGLWNSHTSFGNILGSVIAGHFADTNWGLSFIVPACIIGGIGILVFFFLVPSPDEVHCERPDHEGKQQLITNSGSVYQPVPTAESVQEGDDPASSDSSVEEGRGNNAADSLLVNGDGTTALSSSGHEKAISFLGALKIPGVVEFSLCLFFAKFVSYVFLFWLPDYITVKLQYKAELAADLSTVFDFGGIFGGIVAGIVSDVSGCRATTCCVMLIFAAPMLFFYNAFTSSHLWVNIVMLLVLGALVNGPYALITTAVSADLGTHKSLMGNSKALATVTAIIDGTGSIGAAVGPQMTGIIKGWNNVFYMLIVADLLALVLLIRLVVKEISGLCRNASLRRAREI